MSKITASQTIGPFSHEAWQWAVDGCHSERLQTTAPTIIVRGTVFDGDGTPVNDAQIEVWLPEADTSEAAQPLPAFRRMPTDAQGEFRLRLPPNGNWRRSYGTSTWKICAGPCILCELRSAT